jgi:hypothetical protein
MMFANSRPAFFDIRLVWFVPFAEKSRQFLQY